MCIIVYCIIVQMYERLLSLKRYSRISRLFLVPSLSGYHVNTQKYYM